MTGIEKFEAKGRFVKTGERYIAKAYSPSLKEEVRIVYMRKSPPPPMRENEKFSAYGALFKSVDGTLTFNAVDITPMDTVPNGIVSILPYPLYAVP